MEQVGSDLRADLQQLVAFNLRPHLKAGRLGEAILPGWCSLCRGWLGRIRELPIRRLTNRVLHLAWARVRWVTILFLRFEQSEPQPLQNHISLSRLRFF